MTQEKQQLVYNNEGIVFGEISIKHMDEDGIRLHH
jgi:hypothetical protein